MLDHPFNLICSMGQWIPLLELHRVQIGRKFAGQ